MLAHLIVDRRRLHGRFRPMVWPATSDPAKPSQWQPRRYEYWETLITRTNAQRLARGPPDMPPKVMRLLSAYSRELTSKKTKRTIVFL